MGAGPVWGVGRRDPGVPVTITPSQLTANTDNYDPGFVLVGLSQPTYILRLSSDASRNLTGIVAAAYDGQMVYIVNVGAQNIVLMNESASSEEANRILSSSGADYTLTANAWVLGIYDMTSQRWRI